MNTYARLTIFPEKICDAIYIDEHLVSRTPNGVDYWDCTYQPSMPPAQTIRKVDFIVNRVLSEMRMPIGYPGCADVEHLVRQLLNPKVMRPLHPRDYFIRFAGGSITCAEYKNVRPQGVDLYGFIKKTSAADRPRKQTRSRSDGKRLERHSARRSVFTDRDPQQPI